MSAQPIFSELLDEDPKSEGLPKVRPSPLQGLQPMGPGSGEVSSWSFESGRALLQEPAMSQGFFQPGFLLDFDTSVSETAVAVGEIDALFSGEDDEVVPTQHAYLRARSLVQVAYSEINSLN